MINRRIIRSLAVAATVAALIVAGIAVPASARHGRPAHAGRTHEVKAAKSTKVKTTRSQAEARKAAARARQAEAKARKAARFVATGTVSAIDGSAVTVAVVGGTKSLRGTDSVFTVAADARINRDDAVATLADIVVGDHVALRGARSSDALAVNRVNATSPEPVDEPTEDVTETVTDDPTEDPTEAAPLAP